MSFVAKMSSTGLLFVLSIGTGFWLSSYGKPFLLATLITFYY